MKFSRGNSEDLLGLLLRRCSPKKVFTDFAPGFLKIVFSKTVFTNLPWVFGRKCVFFKKSKKVFT